MTKEELFKADKEEKDVQDNEDLTAREKAEYVCFIIDCKHVATMHSDQSSSSSRMPVSDESPQQKQMKVSLPRLVESAGKLEGGPDSNRTLLHYKVVEKGKYAYMKAVLVYASDAVRDHIADHYEKQELHTLQLLLLGLQQYSETGGLRGVLFEHFAHKTIVAGGKIFVRPLGTDWKKSEQITFAAARKKFFTTAAEIGNLTATTYDMPKPRNFPSIDAVMQPDCLFQMTVSGPQQKQVKLEGSKAVLAHMSLTLTAMTFLLSSSFVDETSTYE